jgi:hypothetical protein
MGSIKLNGKHKKEKKPLYIYEDEVDDIEQVFEEDDEDEEEYEEEIKIESTNLEKAVAPNTLKKVVNEALEDLKNHDVSVQNVEDQTDKMVEKVHQSAVMHTVKNNDNVQKKVLQSAEEEVLSSIEIKKNKQQLRVVRATYNANKDACENLGLDEAGRPMWQITIAKVINNFWFVVWALISFFTLTPIIFFLKRIGTQVKSAKLKWLLAFLFYIMILFLLFLLIATIWSKNPNAPEWIKSFIGTGE